jgi:maleylacetate reductase
MNALAHCVEAAWSPRRTPEAEAVALAGFRRIIRALPTVVEDPTDLDARTAMFEGAVLGGRCLHNASMGVHHGLAQLLGGRTGIPHGVANAVILPHAIRFNAEAVPDAVAALAGTIDAEPETLADVVAMAAGFLGLPTRLSECGVAEDDLDAVARLSQSSPNVRNNPRPVGEADARAILQDAF